ncbi:MAG TPA: hypothetical protein VHE61_12970 [Opitutaceae bacterium]|nr:hypothetical protein [Opitutaceae bacterium]
MRYRTREHTAARRDSNSPAGVGYTRLPAAMFRMRAWLMLIATALVALGLWLTWHRNVRRVQPATAIQDGKTIDFSSGKPVVKDDPKEKEIIDRAVAQMDAAAANVTFSPQPAKPAGSPAAPPSAKK